MWGDLVQGEDASPSNTQVKRAWLHLAGDINHTQTAKQQRQQHYTSITGQKEIVGERDREVVIPITDTITDQSSQVVTLTSSAAFLHFLPYVLAGAADQAMSVPMLERFGWSANRWMDASTNMASERNGGRVTTKLRRIFIGQPQGLATQSIITTSILNEISNKFLRPTRSSQHSEKKLDKWEVNNPNLLY